jgi:tripartite ATP-independent transporter DctM subunit
MQKKGIPVTFAVSVTAASSVMGVIIPPSLLLLVWGAVTETSIGALFIAGIVPGVLIGLGQMIFVYWVARQQKFPVEPWLGGREVLRSAGAAGFALLMPIIIVGGIRGGWVTPTEGSIVAVLYAILLGFVVYRTLSPRELWTVIYESGRMVTLSLFCIGSAGLFGFLLAYYKLPAVLGGLSAHITSPSLFLLFIAALFLVLGCFLDGLVITIICGPLFLPAVQNLGIDPLQYGIVGCVAIAMGLLTPPYGLCLIITAGIGKVSIQEAMPYTMRLFGVMLAVLLLFIFVPEVILTPVRWIGP